MSKTNKVVVTMLLAGFAFVLVGFALRGAQQLRSIYTDSDNSLNWINSETVDIYEEFENITNLDLDIDAYDVRIEEHDGENIIVEGTVRETLAVTKKGNTLNFKENDHFFHWDMGSISNGAGTITIKVPKGTVFNQVSIDLDAGSVTIVNSLEARNVEFDVDAGSIDATKIIANRTEFNVDAGGIDIQSLDSQDTEVDVDAGSFTAIVVGVEQDYSYDVSCDLGSLQVGSYYVDGISNEENYRGGNRNIEAECSVGSITIDMEGDN